MNCRLVFAAIVALVISGCAANGDARPTPSGAATTPRIVASPSTVTPTATATVTAVPTATATVTAVPTATAWREVAAQPSVSGVTFTDVAWAGTRFVAVGNADDHAVFLDSMDGVTWHRQPGRSEVGGPTRVATGPGGVVAIGMIGEQQASWFSLDGLTWTAHRDAFHTATGARSRGDVGDVIAAGAGWLAVGSHVPNCAGACAPDRALVWTSSDGLVWTQVPDQAAFKDGWMNSVADLGSGFVAGGESIGAATWTSADGLAWSRVPEDPVFEGPAGPDYGTAGAAVAARDGVIAMIGLTSLKDDSTAAIAWWSASGGPWSRVDVAGETNGEMSLTTTPDGFEATGWFGDCIGGIWASADGRDWRCDASDPEFKGFAPVAAAASDSVEIVVGMTSHGEGDTSPPPSTTIWYRTWQ